MSTTHEMIAQDLLADIIAHPGATATLNEVRGRLSLDPGHPHGFPVGFADAIGQIYRGRGRGRWPMEQVAAFTQVHAGLVSGRYGMIRIGGAHLEGGPGPDRDREGNAAKLSELYGPFVAEVDLEQNGGDSDGMLTWDEPIRCEKSMGVSFIDPCPRAAMRRLVKLVTVETRFAPLEIGYSLPSRTLWHLLEDGMVARWPYGADHLTLFVHFEPYWSSMWTGEPPA